MRLKILWILLITLFLTGCGSKQLYTIGDTSNVSPNGASQQTFIAVEKVELPIYFMDSPIYKKDSPYHLQEIDNANWIHSMDVHLTNVLISYLQKSMGNPNIYAYPWSTMKQIDKKVSLNISNFIAYKKEVSLDANYQILDKHTKNSSNNLFHTKIPIEGKSVESMIKAMEKAYFMLAKEINQKLLI